MSKSLIILIFLPFIGLAQSSGKIWTEVGVKGSITKDLDWGLELTNRFGDDGLETFFPQATIKYKVTKWFRPSMDYRAIFKKENNGNYSFSNRLNINAEFKHTISRFSGSLRARYQYSFDRFTSGENYDAEFDQAIRLKPQIVYDINNSIVSPILSFEWFFNPNYGPLGQRITKYRAFFGLELEMDSPHEISAGYILDQQINVPGPERKHILSLSYAYNLGFKKKKKD